MLESILWPSRTVAPTHEATIVDTTDGTTLTGLVLKEDAQSVTLKTAAAEPVVVEKARIKARRKDKVSVMPDTIVDGYSQTQIANLIAFLEGK